jgi:hypothetical protein
MSCSEVIAEEGAELKTETDKWKDLVAQATSKTAHHLAEKLLAEKAECLGRLSASTKTCFDNAKSAEANTPMTEEEVTAKRHSQAIAIKLATQQVRAEMQEKAQEAQNEKREKATARLVALDIERQRHEGQASNSSNSTNSELQQIAMLEVSESGVFSLNDGDDAENLIQLSAPEKSTDEQIVAAFAKADAMNAKANENREKNAVRLKKQSEDLMARAKEQKHKRDNPPLSAWQRVQRMAKKTTEVVARHALRASMKICNQTYTALKAEVDALPNP